MKIIYIIVPIVILLIIIILGVVVYKKYYMVDSAYYNYYKVIANFIKPNTISFKGVNLDDKYDKVIKQYKTNNIEEFNENNLNPELLKHLSKYNPIEQHIGMLLYDTKYTSALSEAEKYKLKDFIKDFNKLFKNAK